jgi:hypothetical protein
MESAMFEILFCRKAVQGDWKPNVGNRIFILRKLMMEAPQGILALIVALQTTLNLSETHILVRGMGSKLAFRLTAGLLVEVPIPEGLVVTTMGLCSTCKGAGGTSAIACNMCSGLGLDVDTLGIIGHEYDAGHCGQCMGTGLFVVGTENGKPKFGGGDCYKCTKGVQTSCGIEAHLKRKPHSKNCCDVSRNYLYSMYGVRA